MLQDAKAIAIDHLLEELGMVRLRLFAAKPAPKAKPQFPAVDQALDAYSEQRAFWITGIVKEDILKEARAYIFQYAKEHPGLTEAGVGFEEGLYNALRKWLPVKDAAGRPINQAARSETIARTNIMDMYNHARGVMMTAPELAGWVDGYRYSATLDSSTTPLCRHLHGKIFTPETINGYNPPNHFNCRSILLPVTKLDEGWEAEMKGQGPITHTPADGFSSGWLQPPGVPAGKTPIPGAPLPGALPPKPSVKIVKPEAPPKPPPWKPPQHVRELLPEWDLISPEAKASLKNKYEIADDGKLLYSKKTKPDQAAWDALKKIMDEDLLAWIKQMHGVTPVVPSRGGREPILSGEELPPDAKVKPTPKMMWDEAMKYLYPDSPLVYETQASWMKQKVNSWTQKLGKGLTQAQIAEAAKVLAGKIPAMADKGPTPGQLLKGKGKAQGVPAAPAAAPTATPTPAGLGTITVTIPGIKWQKWVGEFPEKFKGPTDWSAFKDVGKKAVWAKMKSVSESVGWQAQDWGGEITLPANALSLLHAHLEAVLMEVYGELFPSIGSKQGGVSKITLVKKPKTWAKPSPLPAGEPAAAPVPPPKATAPPAPEPAAPPVKLGKIPGVQVLEESVVLGQKLTDAKGSNPGGTYRGTDGVERYVKFYQDPTQAYTEMVSNNIYRALGHGAPTSAIFEHNGKWAIASEILPGTKGTLKDLGVTPAAAKKFLDGFVADVLTANWDAVGTGFDNVVILKTGEVVRVDQGGSLLFRAKAGRKNVTALHGITEIEGFANSSKNPYYSQVMNQAGITSAAELGQSAFRQLDTLKALYESTRKFADLVPEIQGVPVADRMQVLDMLRARYAQLQDVFRKEVYEFLHPPPAPPPVEVTGRGAPTDPLINDILSKFDQNLKNVRTSSRQAHGPRAMPVSPGEVAEAARAAISAVAGAKFANNFLQMRKELWGGWKGSAQCGRANFAKFLAEKAGISGHTTFTSTFIDSDPAARTRFLNGMKRKVTEYGNKYGHDVVERYALLEYQITQRILKQVYGDGPLPPIYRGVSPSWFSDNKVPAPSVSRGGWKPIVVHQNSVSGWSTQPDLSFGGGYKFKTVPKREEIFTAHFLVDGAQSYLEEMEWWFLSTGPQMFQVTRM